jgi:hypothetical protein
MEKKKRRKWVKEDFLMLNPTESFEDWAVRVGHKLYGLQCVDGSKYHIKIDGSVVRSIGNVNPPTQL